MEARRLQNDRLASLLEVGNAARMLLGALGGPDLASSGRARRPESTTERTTNALRPSGGTPDRLASLFRHTHELRH
jgi:hypothetical protein